MHSRAIANVLKELTKDSVLKIWLTGWHAPLELMDVAYESSSFCLVGFNPLLKQYETINQESIMRLAYYQEA